MVSDILKNYLVLCVSHNITIVCFLNMQYYEWIQIIKESVLIPNNVRSMSSSD